MTVLVPKRVDPEVPGVGDRYVAAPTDDPDAFALIVDGDSMAPDYQRGDVVIFSPLEVERYGVVPGKDYAIQLGGEDASTFKRVTIDEDDSSVLVLTCVNPKYPSSQRVKREGVMRLARAIWVSKASAVPPAPRVPGHSDESRPAETVGQWVESTARVRGGRPRIAGTRISVDDVVIMHRHVGRSLEEIAGKFKLPPAAVYAAMAYYYDHKDEVDALIAQDDATAEAFKQNSPSPLREKLKARDRG